MLKVLNIFSGQLIVIVFLTFVSIGVSRGQVNNVMWIDTLSSNPNDTVEFSVKINNTQNFVAFQLDVVFPLVLSYIPNSSVLTSRSNGHSLSASIISPNRLRIIAFSFNNAPFNDTTGAVMTFKFRAGTLHGQYGMDILNPLIVDSLNNNILTGFSNGRFTLFAPSLNVNPNNLDFIRTPIDVPKDLTVTIYNNGNANLNVTKLATTSNDFKFLDSSGFTLGVGSSINRTIRLLSNTRGIKNGILKVVSNNPSDTLYSITATGIVYAVNELYLSNNFARSGNTTEIKLRLKNYDPITAFQLSIPLPADFSYMNGSIELNPDRREDHIINASIVSGNILNIVAFSPSNSPFSLNDSSVASFRLFVAGNPGYYTLQLNDGILSNQSGKNVISDSYNGSVSLISPIISFSNSLSFDSVSYLDTASKYLHISNIGNDTLVIDSLKFNNTNFFSNITFPFIISPVSSDSILIKFYNTSIGNHSGTATIYNNDFLNNPSYVSLTSTVYKPNRMYVISKDVNTRDTSFLSLGIINHQPFVAFQCDVTLPPEMEFQTNTVQLSPRSNGHNVFASVLQNGDIRIVSFSFNQNSFLGDSGEIVRFNFIANADTGIFNVILKNIVISDSSNANISSGHDDGFIRVNPLPPLLSSPPNQSIVNSPSVLLNWTRSEFASEYHLQLATDSLFTNLVINDSTLTDTLFQTSSLVNDSSYYWRVKIKYFNGQSSFSEVWSFEISSELVSIITMTLIPEGFYNTITNRLNSRDTVRAYLREIFEPFEIVDSAIALLDSVDFTAEFEFKDAEDGIYYIVIKHRNSLETWSKAGGEDFIRGENISYNFTTEQTQAFGNNLILKAGFWCLISGDVDGNGIINAVDRAFAWNLRNSSGYFPEDVNGDGLIDAQDRGIIWNNRNKGVSSPVTLLKFQNLNAEKENF